MELDEFHVLHRSLGTVNHGDAVARGYQRIGGVSVNGFTTSCSHDGYLGEEGVHFSRILVQYIGAIALDARRVARHDDAQMVLCDDFHRIVVGEYADVGMPFHSFDERSLYLGSRVVLVVQDAEFRVTAFFVQVECPVFLFVEVHAPVDELLDLFGCVAHHLLHGGAVADPVAGYHGVFDVLVEVVHGQIGYRGDASLCKIRVGLFHSGLTDEGYRPLFRHFQGEAHTGYS